ncbi:MAG: ysdA [Erysipelotrichaceae bacterium]|nr:MAG: hypothetical protein FD179_187 [Erysipelotrichaceae bacterium]TXT17652.1 MAG: ysdA [Erysipelotrichaceae bacterium]
MQDLILIILFFVLINLLGYTLMGMDKSYAQKQSYRISEKTLLLIALFGGAIGVYLGMMHFHHKTKKPLFNQGVPVMIIINIFMLGVFITSKLG